MQEVTMTTTGDTGVGVILDGTGGRSLRPKIV